MIPQCPTKECCNPDLFNYSLNLKDPVFNREVTLFLFCPPEWNCSDPEIMVVVPPGKWPVVPHNGDDESQCEADRFAVRDAVTQLISLIQRYFLIGNDEVTVTCADFELEGEGSFTLPENSLFELGHAGFAGNFTEELATVLQVCPIDFSAVQRVLSRAQPYVTDYDAAKARANEQAQTLARNIFFYRLSQGQIVCEEGDVPAGLFEDDDSIHGQMTTNYGAVGSVASFPSIQEAAQYRVEWVSGLAQHPFALLNCTAIDPPNPTFQTDTLIHGVNLIYLAGPPSERYIRSMNNGVETGNFPGQGFTKGDRGDTACAHYGMFGDECSLGSAGGLNPNYPCNEVYSSALINDTTIGQQEAAEAAASTVSSVITLPRFDEAVNIYGAKVKHGGMPNYRKSAHPDGPYILPDVSSGSTTWRLRRIRKQVDEWPFRLRIRPDTMAAFLANLRTCVNQNVSVLPVWDGQIEHREISGASFTNPQNHILTWRTRPLAGSIEPPHSSVRGADMVYSQIYWDYDFPYGPGGPAWVFELYLLSETSTLLMPYAAVKPFGSGPGGLYFWVPLTRNDAYCRLWQNNVFLKTTEPLPPFTRTDASGNPDANGLYITANQDGAFPLVDGVLPSSGSGWLLVTEEPDKEFNGHYFPDGSSQWGGDFSPWRLRRHVGFSGSQPLTQYNATLITGGNTHANQVWEISTPGTATPWVDPVDWAQVVLPPIIIESY